MSAWQPLPPLHENEIHTFEFQKSNLEQHKASVFEAWALNEDHLLHSNVGSNSRVTDSSSDKSNDDAKHDTFFSEIENQKSDLEQNFDSTFLASMKEEAYQNGILEGKKQQKMEFEAAVELERASELENEKASTEKFNLQVIDLLNQISTSANELIQNSSEIHEPLKRLALHLAEQLTLTELSISANSIQNLIQRSIETLDAEDNPSLQVELNPVDLEILQKHLSASEEIIASWRLTANPHLLPGSVTVRADDSAVSDFVENRLESLAKSLLIEPSRWHAQSAFQAGRLSRRTNSSLDVEDAMPRATPTVNNQLNDIAGNEKELHDPILPSNQTLEHDE